MNSTNARKPVENHVGVSARETQRPASGSSSPDGVLLTGATGFVGIELLARYLVHTDSPVYALVRAGDDGEAQARVDAVMRGLFGVRHDYDERVVAVRGDITRARLGLGRRFGWLAERVGEIVHGAASVSFTNSLEEARAANLDGTRQVLAFAERCRRLGGLRRLTYISTAYVAGDHPSRFSEDDLDVGQRFHNTYELSKFEAERLLRTCGEHLPLTIVRPSIVVGERTSGWTCSFNVMYWPLRAFSRGTYVAVPGRASAPVDVVPVDYVADATFALSRTPAAEGATFHLTAGRDASSLGELIELASSYFGRQPPRLIDPLLYRRVVHPLLRHGTSDPRRRRSLERSEVFFPYFAGKVRYDDRQARAALHDSGIEPSPLHDYFERLMEFAVRSDWGRHHVPRSGRVVTLGSARRGRRPLGVRERPVVVAR